MKLILVFMDSCHDWFCTGAKWPYHTNIWNPSCSIFAPSLSIPHTLLCSACSNLWFFSQNMTNVNYNTVKHCSHLKGYTHSSLVTVGLADWAVMEKYEKQYLLTSTHLIKCFVKKCWLFSLKCYTKYVTFFHSELCHHWNKDYTKYWFYHV